MKELSTERFVEPYAEYMQLFSKVKFFDEPISELSVSGLSKFANSDGAFTKSFDAVLDGYEKLEELFIVSSTAYYESENGEIPAVQVRIIDGDGGTLYYSPVYEIGHTREFYRREWRIMPIFNRYCKVRFSFIIPDGVRLYIRSIKIKSNYGYRERDIGIRFHGHGGYANAFGMQLVAEAGFTSCITIPKFTKDGIGICMHDDETIIKEMTFDDGSLISEGSELDRPVSDFTYDELMQFSTSWIRRSDIFSGIRIPTMDEFFRICSMTGMQPIFSVHPELTKEQWLYVRELLIKYNLLEHFWVKSGRVNTQRICKEVFGTDIAGRILLQRAVDDWDPLERANEMGLDAKEHNVVIEFFGFVATEKKIVTAKNEGFKVSIAAMMGGHSGPHIQRLIDLGVTEFTLDHHLSMGLSW